MMRQLIDNSYDGIHACLPKETLCKIKEKNKGGLRYKFRLDSLSGETIDYP